MFSNIQADLLKQMATFDLDFIAADKEFQAIHSELMFDVEEDKKESPKQERLCKVGQVIVGRLNIHHPVDGTPTKYYINWCNRTHDNLLMSHEEMQKIFGSLKPLKVGMYFEITVSHVPEDPKVHPTGVNAKQVPVPAHKLKKNKRRQSKKFGRSAPRRAKIQLPRASPPRYQFLNRAL